MPFMVSATSWVNPAGPMSWDMTILVSIRLMICRPAEPRVMGTAMASSRLAVALRDSTGPLSSTSSFLAEWYWLYMNKTATREPVVTPKMAPPAARGVSWVATMIT